MTDTEKKSAIPADIRDAGQHSCDNILEDEALDALLYAIRQQTHEQTRSDAFLRLCERYRPLTERLVAQYMGIWERSGVCSVPDRRELAEEACIALYHAAMFYRSGTHATFGYFARVCIRNRLVSFLRAQRVQAKPVPDYELYAAADAEEAGADVGEMYVRRDAFRILFDRFLSSLTDYERRVFHGYIQGKSYREIADMLSVPIKSVDNAVYRIRVKLKQQLQSQ